MSTTAKCKTGKYIGHALESGVVEYRGIPYAKPPKRWQPAEELDSSDAEFEASEWGAAAWQELQPEEWPGVPPLSEDCLTLNVWTSDPDTKGKPVLVWIHGGCYATGSNRPDCFGGVYCGDKFVETSKDIVYVNINYRIGIFGCLDLTKFDKDGTYKYSTNLQTLDQILALKWIHENIEGFGGDPDKVTISGQSAGGMSVATLMALPEANQYFRGVICESTALSETLLKYHKETQAQADRFCNMAGVSTLEELLAMDAEKLRDISIDYFYSAELWEGGVFEQIWNLGIFPNDPVEGLRKGVAKDIKLMIGTVSGEFDTAGLHMSDEELKGAGMGVFPGKMDDAFVERFVANYPERDRRTSYQDLWNDNLLRMGAVCTADAQVKGGGDVYMYYMPCIAEGATIRPQHCFEIPYFNMKKDALVYMDRSTDEPVQGNKPSAKLEKEIHGCWANFVRTGDPNGDHLQISWPKYTEENKETAIVDHTWSAENGVRNRDTEMLLPFHVKK